jgi:hypothetical protein
VNVSRNYTTVHLLDSRDEYRRYYQIDIRQCFDDGRDCRIHGLRILGCKLMKDEEHPSVSTAIVSDSQEVEEESLQACQERQQHTAARGQAGGVRRWLRRVFKKRDQEGGPKAQVCVSGGGGIIKVPPNAHILTPFFQKTMFFLFFSKRTDM